MQSQIYGRSAIDFPGIGAANVLTTTSQYAVVTLGVTTTAVDFTFVLADTTTVFPYAIGINQTYVTSGGSPAINVRMSGISKAISGATVSAGDALTPTALGRVIPFVTTTGTITASTRIIGYALTTVQTAGAEVTILVQPHNL